MDEEEEEPVNEEDFANASSKIMSYNWKKIGLELGLSETQVDRVNYDYSKDGLDEIIHQMLSTWKCSFGTKATKKKLKNTLDKIASQDIKENSQEIKDQQYAAYLLQIQSDMENTYGNLELPHVSWYDYFDKILPLKDYYVDLLMEGKDIYGNESMVDIKLEHIFDKTDNKPVKRILIEGHPGYGKTTVICKLASDWANGCPYIREKFDLIFVVLLREFDDNLGEILLEQCDVEELTSSVKKDVIARTEERTLLLMDGFDELNETSKNKILPVVQKKAYKLMTVVVTSRTEEMHLKEMKKTHLASIGAKTKDFSFLSLWDKRIQIKGISEGNRQRFLEMYFETDPKLIYEKMSHLVSDKLQSLYECPLFLLLLAVLIEEEVVKEITTKTELYQKVVNFIVKRYLIKNNIIGDQVEIDVFNFNQEIPSFNPLLLVQFGELALEKLQTDRLTFSEEELLKTCKKDQKILHLGFLHKNSTFKRKKLEFLYEPIHKTFLEFLASVYVFYLNIFYEKNNFKDKIISLFTNGFLFSTTSLFCSFLVGLLGRKAHEFLKLIHPFAGLFSKSFVMDVYSEIEKTEENKSVLLPFIPSRLYLDKDTFQRHFANSFLQSSFLELAFANIKIDELVWDLSCEFSIPLSFYVPNLVFSFTPEFEKVTEYFADKKIACNQLIISGKYASITPEKWKIFINIINEISFNFITFKSNVFPNPNSVNEFHKEINEGRFNNLKIHLLESNQAMPEMLSLSETLVNLNMVNSMLGDCHQVYEDRNVFKIISYSVQKIVDASCASNSLKRLYFSNLSEYRRKIILDLSHLCSLDNKKWELLHIDKKVVWKNYENCKGLLKVEGLVFSPERESQLTADCNVLQCCCCLQAISLPTDLFYHFVRNAPSEWSGFRTASEIHLFVTARTYVASFHLLSRFHEIKKLIIDDSEYNIDRKYADNLIMGISEFTLDVLHFRNPNSISYTFLASFLEKVSGQQIHDEEISEKVQQRRNMFHCRTLRIDFGMRYLNEETIKQVICLSIQLLQKHKIDKVDFLYANVPSSPFRMFLFNLIESPVNFKYSYCKYCLKNDLIIYDFENDLLESISVSLIDI